MAKRYRANIKTSLIVDDGETVDVRYRLWPSRTAALAGVQGIQRKRGMLIPVSEGATIVLYWFKDGLADIDFIPYDSRTGLPDGLLISGVSFNVDQTIVTLTGTKWRISEVDFTLASPVSFPVPAPDAGGLLRIDNIIADFNGQVTYQTGIADENAVAPEVPYKHILVTTIYVSLDETVEDPGTIAVSDGETLFGPNDPLSGLGKNGDAYLQQTLGTIWKKEMVAGVATWVMKYDISEIANSINFQRKFRVIPRILVNTSGPGKCKEFLRIVPANNYCHARISVVNFNSTVKNYEFLTGYDSLSETDWSELVPENVLNDRGEDFGLEIKKVAGFGPTNFGILLRYRNLNASGGSQAAVKVEFALELPAVGVNYETFQVLTTAEYDFSGSTTLYGKKLTLTADGKNWIDTDGKLFLKDSSIKYLGKYLTSAALIAAHPTAEAGDRAQVDAGAGYVAQSWFFDTEEGWVQGGGTGASTFEEIDGSPYDNVLLADELNDRVVNNVPITPGTHTKITYDAKGLVTDGEDATTADIADSADKRYVTDAEKTKLANTSGTNTGDQDLSGKVDKITGWGLTENNYSTADKNKLAALSEHFRGIYVSSAALAAAWPTASQGDYAYVDAGAGQVSQLYVWDNGDSVWRLSGGGGVIVNATETTAGILEIATLAEAIAGTDDQRAMTALKTLALMVDRAKDFEQQFAVLNQMQYSVLMRYTGSLSSILTAGLTGLQVKKNAGGTYATPSYPYTYTAGDRLYFTFSYLDLVEVSGNIILIGRDN